MDARKKSVLIAPGTTGIGMEMFRSLQLNKEFEIHGMGTDYTKAAQIGYLMDRYHQAPSIWEPGWRQVFEEICDQHQFSFILLAHDEYIYELRAIDHVGNSIVVKHNEQAINVASFKSRTYLTFASKIPTPRIYTLSDPDLVFPLFCKPDRGQGSRGSTKINNPEHLKAYLGLMNLTPEFSDSNFILCEYLPGAEFTVDCFSNTKGKVLLASGRRRNSVSSGLSHDNTNVTNNSFLQFAQIISDELGLKGAWFYQLKEDVNGTLKLLEIGLRIAGSSAIRRLEGINLTYLSLKQMDTYIPQLQPVIQVSRHSKVLVDHAYMKFDFEKVYIDYDDTILIDGTLNLEIIKKLVWWKFLGKRIYLITRHAGDLNTSLLKNDLRSIFEEVHHLRLGELKSNYVDSTNGAIFIDDSYAERMDVLSLKSVMVLDPTALVGELHFQ